MSSKATKKVGETYARLKIIEDLGTRRYGNIGKCARYYLCECECGNRVEVSSSNIGKNTRSCGCLNREVISRIIAPGTVFGRLTVLGVCEHTERKTYYDGHGYRCECKCGNIVVVHGGSLRKGRTRSCGCMHHEMITENIKTFHEKIIFEGTNIPSISSNKLRIDNTSGVRGVHRRKNRWQALITFKNKDYYLGSYDDLDEAVRVRKEAEDRLFGAFLEWYRNRGTTEASFGTPPASGALPGCPPSTDTATPTER